MFEKVYCDDCKYQGVREWSSDGWDYMLCHTQRCEHPANTHRVSTALEHHLEYGDCKKINANNDCPQYNEWEYKLVDGSLKKRHAKKSIWKTLFGFLVA